MKKHNSKIEGTTILFDSFFAHEHLEWVMSARKVADKNNINLRKDITGIVKIAMSSIKLPKLPDYDYAEHVDADYVINSISYSDNGADEKRNLFSDCVFIRLEGLSLEHKRSSKKIKYDWMVEFDDTGKSSIVGDKVIQQSDYATTEDNIMNLHVFLHNRPIEMPLSVHNDVSIVLTKLALDKWAIGFRTATPHGLIENDKIYIEGYEYINNLLVIKSDTYNKEINLVDGHLVGSIGIFPVIDPTEFRLKPDFIATDIFGLTGDLSAIGTKKVFNSSKRLIIKIEKFRIKMELKLYSIAHEHGMVSIQESLVKAAN